LIDNIYTAHCYPTRNNTGFLNSFSTIYLKKAKIS